MERTSNSEEFARIVKEALAVSMQSANLQFALSKRNTKRMVIDGVEQAGQSINNKIKAVAGDIKENSKLYDQIKEKKGILKDAYESSLEELANYYDSKIMEAELQRTELFSQNLSLATDIKNKQNERKEAEKDYKNTTKELDSKSAKKMIETHRTKAEEYMEQGNIEAYKKEMEKYHKLVSVSEGMREDKLGKVGEISFQINENKRQMTENELIMVQLSRQIEELENAKQRDIQEAVAQKDKMLMETNEKTTIFQKAKMALAKIFTFSANKGKKVQEEIILPTIAKVKKETPERIEKAKSTAKAIEKTTIEKATIAMENIKETKDKTVTKVRTTKNLAIDKAIEKENSLRQKGMNLKIGVYENLYAAKGTAMKVHEKMKESMIKGRDWTVDKAIDIKDIVTEKMSSLKETVLETGSNIKEGTIKGYKAATAYAANKGMEAKKGAFAKLENYIKIHRDRNKEKEASLAMDR